MLVALKEQVIFEIKIDDLTKANRITGSRKNTIIIIGFFFVFTKEHLYAQQFIGYK